MPRGVIDVFRNGSSNEQSKQLKSSSNGRYLKCSRNGSIATATSVTSLSDNEYDDDSLRVNKKIPKISETSEQSSFEADKMKTPMIPNINVQEDEF